MTGPLNPGNANVALLIVRVEGHHMDIFHPKFDFGRGGGLLINLRKDHDLYRI